MYPLMEDDSMNRVYKNLYICIKIWKQELKSKMSYRTDFIVSLLCTFISNICGILFWKVLFLNISEINGWSYEQLLFIYGFSLVSNSIVVIFFDNGWNLQRDVYSGDFIRYCIRPINSFLYFFSESFGIGGIGQLILGIIIMINTIGTLIIKISFLMIILLIFYLLSASLFMIALQNIASASCFWLINSGIVVLFVNDFKDFAKYPITIFNKLFRFVFTFIIPIAFMSYYPSSVFLTDKPHIFAYLTPLFGITFFLFSYKIWILGAKNYSGTGT